MNLLKCLIESNCLIKIALELKCRNDQTSYIRIKFKKQILGKLK